ncbi:MULTISPECIES: CHASE2 domain-containing protein [Aerosakkonema]|uniref:CHASE2 domain-containing protein n=1 Tax=Aerosakkonema TaxID=1246629 RepID=UPI0035B6CD26
MAPEPSLPATNRQTSAVTRSGTTTKSSVQADRVSRLARLSHIVTGAWALAAGLATAGNLGLVQMMEYNTQTLLFELRGPVAPPDEIVILAIDEQSVKEGQFYQQDPKKYGYLEPLQVWPWKRSAYAIAIDKLMKAGAKSVAVDVVFDRLSNDKAADKYLQQVLQRYPGRIALAAMYEDTDTQQGSLIQPTLPNSIFRTKPISAGIINYPLEVDGRIHRFSNEFIKQLSQTYSKQVKEEIDALTVAVPSFDEAALIAAGQSNIRAKGDRIYFYGPKDTFKQIPFFHVLDPYIWNNHLQQEKFKDKIVLIGPTTITEVQDFHKAPFSGSLLYREQMSGVEIHANAIATLMQGKAIGQAIPNPLMQGLFVFGGVLGTGVFLSKRKRSLNRFGWAIGIAAAWGTVSYFTFTYGQLILPTAVPAFAIVLSGFFYLTGDVSRQQIGKFQLRQTLKRYVTSPIVQEILSQHDDLQDLLPLKDSGTANKKIGGRYEIIKVLGAGGFGETYIAQDTQRPGKPLCVVKQLKPATNDPKHLELARRLFPREADALEKLGQHKQIPQLLAYFEEGDEFYLVQEFIPGHSLEYELIPGKPLPESQVIEIMLELLEVLEFVHSQGVIHRDIKPNNIIRRDSDDKLVLIDFGAVKEVSTQLLENDGQSRFTVGIGTQGYAPPEQCAGRPRPNSDIYAVGITAIKALTGLSPNQLQQDIKSGEILWTHKAQVNPELAAIISKMVRYDYHQRYQSASEIKEALLEIKQSATAAFSLTDSPIDSAYSDEYDAPTKAWGERSETLYPLEETQEYKNQNN